MSLESWKSEFYPITAESLEDYSDRGMIEHAIKKWEGALPENTAKHGVCYEDHAIIFYEDHAIIFGEEVFNFGFKECALCAAYSDGKGNCSSDCPLVRIGEGCMEAYSAYDHSADDPSPMLAALRAALAAADKENHGEDGVKQLLAAVDALLSDAEEWRGAVVCSDSVTEALEELGGRTGAAIVTENLIMALAVARRGISLEGRS